MRAAKEAVAPMVTKQVLGEEEEEEVAIGWGREAVCSKRERGREGGRERWKVRCDSGGGGGGGAYYLGRYIWNGKVREELYD